jgi:hypothetical protein
MMKMGMIAIIPGAVERASPESRTAKPAAIEKAAPKIRASMEMDSGPGASRHPGMTETRGDLGAIRKSR